MNGANNLGNIKSEFKTRVRNDAILESPEHVSMISLKGSKMSPQIKENSASVTIVKDYTRDVSVINNITQNNIAENIPEINPKEKGIIVARIDNIYLSIKDTPKYYSKIRILIFIISVFSLTHQWMFLSISGPAKNNYYCLDAFSREFKLCDQSEFCHNVDTGLNYFVFIDDEKIANKDILTEIYNINKNYLNYFLKDGLRFSMQNAKFDKYVEVDTLYIIVFAITYNEKWNIYSTFSQYCKRQETVSQLVLSMFVSIIIGNLMWGFLADVFGRKPILIIMGTIQFLGAIIIFSVTRFILSTGKPIAMTTTNNIQNSTAENITTNFDTSRSFLFDYKSDPNISNYTTFKIDSFENQDINKIYETQFNANNQELINHKTIQRNFSKYKFLILTGFVLIFFCTSATNNISLAYILENSINDTEVYSNYAFLHYSIPLSYLLHFILLTMINSFHIPILICASITLIATLFLLFIAYESPRHHYEFFEYKKITQFFEGIVQKELIEKFYRSDEVPKFRKEIQKQIRKVNYLEVLCGQVIFLGYNARQRRYKDMVLQNKMVEVRRYEILRNPYLLFLLIIKNKQVKKNLLVIISLVAIIGFIFNLTICKFNLNLVHSRESFYNNIIVNQAVFYLALNMALSLYIFNFILKFFGFSIILLICFAVIFFFSLMFELFSLGSRNFEDMNVYTYNSMDIIFKQRGATLLTFLFIVTFFSTALYGVMFFYLTKLTKTLYRCTYYGMFRCILDFTVLFSIALSQYFEKNFFYVSVLSVIGFVNTYFIQEDFDFTLVADFREIELEDD
jgi:hypothetical protein